MLNSRSEIAVAKVLAVLVLFCFAKSVIAGTPADDQENARLLYQAEDWQAAAEAMERFASNHPDHPWTVDSRFYRAEALCFAKQFDHAAFAYAQYLQEIGADESAYVLKDSLTQKHIRKAMFQLGECAYRSQQLDLAEKALSEFCRRFPNDQWTRLALPGLGAVSFDQGDVERARSYFELALAKYPEAERADYCRQVLKQCDDFEAALAQSTDGERPSQQNQPISRNDTSLPNDIDRAELVAISKAGAKADRRWYEATLRLAQADLGANELAAAEARINAVLESQSPSHWQSHTWFLKGQVAAIRSDWRQAEVAMRRYLENPDSAEIKSRVEAQFWLAESLFRLSADPASEPRVLVDTVQDAFDAVGGKDEETRWAPIVDLRSAQLRARQKDWTLALQQALQVAETWPNFDLQFEADYLVGRCRSMRGEFGEARESYLRAAGHPAAEGTETAAMAQFMIGETYLHQRKCEEALGEYLRVEVLHDWPTWQAAGLLQAGSCYELLRRPKSAVETYARLVSRFPRTHFAKLAEERLLQLNDRKPDDSARSRNERTTRRPL